MTDAVVQIEGLVKRYNGREVVRGISLSIPRGRCFGVLGPNGAGKTTTLRMLLGQSPRNGGRVTVFGLPIPEQTRAVRRRAGVVPQADNLDPDFTVAENLRIYGSYFGLPAKALDASIRELLDFVELADRADTPINTLSGGMKRRLTIARALINDPELIVLDEPTTGLDPQARHLIWSRLRALRDRGKTLLLTTHYMEEAERLCDELVFLDQGTDSRPGLAGGAHPPARGTRGRRGARRRRAGRQNPGGHRRPRRSRRRHDVLLHRRCPRAGQAFRRRAVADLPAPPGEPGRRFPETHRPRPAGLRKL